MDHSVKQPEADEVVKLYCDAWGEADAVKRRSMFEQVFSETSQYMDPQVQFMQWTKLDDYVGSLHQSLPGFHIAVTSDVDSHNHVGRFSWKLVTQDGQGSIEGVDFVEFSEDGKLQRITGFFGSLTSK